MLNHESGKNDKWCCTIPCMLKNAEHTYARTSANKKRMTRTKDTYVSGSKTFFFFFNTHWFLCADWKKGACGTNMDMKLWMPYQRELHLRAVAKFFCEKRIFTILVWNSIGEYHSDWQQSEHILTNPIQNLVLLGFLVRDTHSWHRTLSRNTTEWLRYKNEDNLQKKKIQNSWAHYVCKWKKS